MYIILFFIVLVSSEVSSEESDDEVHNGLPPLKKSGFTQLIKEYINFGRKYKLILIVYLK